MTRRVLLDCDGVLADLVNYFLDWLRVRHDGVERHESQITNWGLAECCGVPSHVEDRFWAENGVARHCERLPAYPGAREFVAELQSTSDLRIVTATSRADWSGQRAKWLEREMGVQAKHQIICGSSEKRFVHGDVLIDDKPQTVAAWRKRHPSGIGVLFARPWNARSWPMSDAGVRRIGSYDQVLELLKGTR